MTIPREGNIKSIKKRSYTFSVYASRDFSRSPTKSKYFRIVAHPLDRSNYILRFSSVRPTAIQYFQYLTNDYTYCYFTTREAFPEFVLSHISWKELVDFFRTEALLEAL